MSSNSASNKSKPTNPRKFAEKIALLNKKEAEANAEFERIIKEVEQTTRSPVLGHPSRSSSGSGWLDAPVNAVVQRMASYDNDSQASFDSSLPLYESNTTPQHMQQVQHQHHQQQQHHHNQQHHHHHQPNEPQQQQQHQNQISFQTPSGLPDIEIYSTDDDNFGQQQVMPSSQNDCSSYNSISAARSLPDIANLRVSGTCLAATAPAAMSYSHQRLLDTGNYNDNSYNYDANSNIVSNGHHQQSNYTNTTTIPQQQQEIAQSCWQQQEFNHLNNNNNNSNHTQTLHQDYYNQPQQHQQQAQHGFMVRANSTNAVLSSWQETNETLSAPRLSNHLSKSSDGCYGVYCEDNSSSSYSGNCADTINDQTTTIRARSISHNNIDSFQFPSGGAKGMPYMEQNTFLETPRHQFYE